MEIVIKTYSSWNNLILNIGPYCFKYFTIARWSAFPTVRMLPKIGSGIGPEIESFK